MPSQPGTQLLSDSGSISTVHTRSRGASYVKLPSTFTRPPEETDPNTVNVTDDSTRSRHACRMGEGSPPSVLRSHASSRRARQWTVTVPPSLAYPSGRRG